MMRPALVIASLALFMLPSSASADVVAPGFVEGCTLPNVQASHPDEICIACNTYYAEPARCDQVLSEGHYTQACRSNGASVWSQIGCRPRTPEDPPAPPPTAAPAPAPAPTPAPAPAAAESSSGCSAGHTPSGAGVLALLGLLGLVMTRRRAR